MTETTLLKYITPFIEKQYGTMNPDISLPVVRIDKELRAKPQDISLDNVNSSSSGFLNSLTSLSRASTAATMASIRRISGKQDDESNENV
jgi:hypothetical protein